MILNNKKTNIFFKLSPQFYFLKIKRLQTTIFNFLTMVFGKTETAVTFKILFFITNYIGNKVSLKCFVNRTNWKIINVI